MIYDRMAAVAKRLLRPASEGGFGQGEIRLVRTLPAPPPANEWEPPLPPERDITVLDAVAKGVSGELVGTEAAPGVQIISTDLEILAAPWPGEYRPTDVIEADGKPVTILKVEKIPAAGTTCAIRFIARG